MDYGLAMSFLTWVMIIFMATGVGLIKMFEHEMKSDKMGDGEKTHIEAFLMMFYDGDLIDKFIFILLHGARFWAIVFTQWYYNKKQ
jgi:hypothetical protein